MSEFMTQISNSVNSMRHEYSTQNLEDEDPDDMDMDSILGKRSTPPPVARSDLRDGGNKK